MGLIGALLGGWITDHFWADARPERVWCRMGTGRSFIVAVCWKIPAQSELLTTGLLCATQASLSMGRYVYTTIACANLADEARRGD